METVTPAPTDTHTDTHRHTHTPTHKHAPFIQSTPYRNLEKYATISKRKEWVAAGRLAGDVKGPRMKRSISSAVWRPLAPVLIRFIPRRTVSNRSHSQFLNIVPSFFSLSPLFQVGFMSHRRQFPSWRGEDGDASAAARPILMGSRANRG